MTEMYNNCNTNTYSVNTAPSKGNPYEPISTGGYIGLSLLMCIPVVGIILAVIWAFGGTKKINKRNYCRAMLIMIIISLIFSLIVGFAVKTMIGKALEEAGIDPKRLTEEGYLESLIPLDDLENLFSENGLDSESLQELMDAMENMEQLEGLDPETLESLQNLNPE